MSNVEVSEKDIEDALNRPDSFAYYGDNEDMFKTWGITGPGMHRDSDCLQISNYETIKADLEKRFPDDVEVICSSHWLVGWSDQIAVRVIDEDGEPTPCFEAVLEWNAALEDYPVADEEDFSRREYEDFLETVENISPSFRNYKGDEYEVIDNLPEDWASEIRSYLFEYHNISTSDEITDDMLSEAYVVKGYAEIIPEFTNEELTEERIDVRARLIWLLPMNDDYYSDWSTLRLIDEIEENYGLEQ